MHEIVKKRTSLVLNHQSKSIQVSNPGDQPESGENTAYVESIVSTSRSPIHNNFRADPKLNRMIEEASFQISPVKQHT